MVGALKVSHRFVSRRARRQRRWAHAWTVAGAGVLGATLSVAGPATAQPPAAPEDVAGGWRCEMSAADLGTGGASRYVFDLDLRAEGRFIATGTYSTAGVTWRFQAEGAWVLGRGLNHPQAVMGRGTIATQFGPMAFALMADVQGPNRLGTSMTFPSPRGDGHARTDCVR